MEPYKITTNGTYYEIPFNMVWKKSVNNKSTVYFITKSKKIIKYD